MDQLTNGSINGGKPCTYDEDNLEWAGTFVMNSITEQLYNDVSSIIGLYPKGPEALAEIIRHKQRVDAAGRRTLESELKTLRLEKQPAEDVLEFSKKVKAIALKLDNMKGSHGQTLTPDLSALVAIAYTYSTVEEFRHSAQQIHLQCEGNPDCMHWTEILRKHIDTYRTLEEKWTPKENRPNQIQMLQEQVNQLQAQIHNNNTRPNQEENGCWDCGEPGKKRGHPGCKSPNTHKHLPEWAKKKFGLSVGEWKTRPRWQNNNNRFPPLPKEGDPLPPQHQTEFKGEIWLYCGKCRSGKGAWFKKGTRNAHKHAQHTDSNALQLSMLQEPVPNQWQMGHIMDNTDNENKDNNENENVEHNDDNDAGSIGTVNEVEAKLGMMTQRDKDMMDQTGRLMLCHEIAVELDDDNISIEELPTLSQRTNDEDSDSEDEEEEDQLNAANKDDLKETQDTNVGEYLSEMRLTEEDSLPQFTFAEGEEVDSEDEEDEQAARWRKRLMKPAPVSRTSQDPPERRVSFNESMNETQTYTPSNW